MIVLAYYSTPPGTNMRPVSNIQGPICIAAFVFKIWWAFIVTLANVFAGRKLKIIVLLVSLNNEDFELTTDNLKFEALHKIIYTSLNGKRLIWIPASFYL